MAVRKLFCGVSLIFVNLPLPLLEVVLEALAVLLPVRVHEDVEICEALAVRAHVEAIVESAKHLKAVPSGHTPNDRVCALLAELHKNVVEKLRHYLHLCGELIEDDLRGVRFRKL